MYVNFINKPPLLDIMISHISYLGYQTNETHKSKQITEEKKTFNELRDHEKQ